MTAWHTTILKPNYAEFRQPSEPDGLWLSLSLNSREAILTSHDGTDYRSPQNRVVYKRMSAVESKHIVGLPE